MEHDCNNYIEIKGCHESVRRLKEFVATPETPLSFSKILPPLVVSECGISHLQAFKYIGRTTNNTFLLAAIDAEGFIKFTREIMPDEEFDLIDPKPDNSANWFLEHWGCRWEPDCIDMEYNENALSYVFVTPSFPPRKVVKKLREAFPDLDISGYFHDTTTDERRYY